MPVNSDTPARTDQQNAAVHEMCELFCSMPRHEQVQDLWNTIEKIAGLEAEVERLRAALAARPQPDEIESLRAIVRELATWDDYERHLPTRLVREIHNAAAVTGSATPTEKDDDE